MKFIVIRETVIHSSFGQQIREFPIIFPDALVHDDMRRSVMRQLQANRPRAVYTCESAGFLSSMDLDANCYGKSESIGVHARGSADNRLIQFFDYQHGVVL